MHHRQEGSRATRSVDIRRWICSLAVGLLVVLPEARAARGVRITEMELDLELDVERGVILETARLTVEGSGPSSFTLSLHENLLAERSRVDTGVIEHRKAGNRLMVVLDPPLDGERRLTFVVSGRPRGEGGSRVGPRWAVLNPADQWYPGLDDTWARTRVRVRGPAGWLAMAPGRPVTTDAGEIREWRSERPVRSVAVAAAPGLELTEATAARVPVRIGSVGAVQAQALAENLIDPMSWFSGALAPYPFDGFNVALIPGLAGRVRAGGMVIVPLAEQVPGRPEAADMLAGQWFGELLPGDGPWIESFAAWQAATYCRDRRLPLPTDIADSRRAYFELPPRKDVPLAAATVGDPEAVIRGKGSAAPDMVRLVVDDRDFFRAITGLFDRPDLAGAPLGLDQIRLALEEQAGRVLDRVFDDWFEGRGAPRLEATVRTMPASTGGFRVDLKLTQKTGPFALPVDVVFHGPGQVHRETVEITETETRVFYTLDFEPGRVEIDPIERIFRWPVVLSP